MNVDPTTTYLDYRAAWHDYKAALASRDWCDAWEHLAAALHSAEALITWLAGGGFPPEDWSPKRARKLARFVGTKGKEPGFAAAAASLLCYMPVTVFCISTDEMESHGTGSVWYNEEDAEYLQPGVYYWHCHSGCLPDSDPFYVTALDATEADVYRTLLLDCEVV